MARAHLEQPRLEGVVDHDVVAVALKAMLVVDHHVLASLEGVHLVRRVTASVT